MARMGHGQMEQYIQQETQKQQMQVNEMRIMLQEYYAMSFSKHPLTCKTVNITIVLRDTC